MRRRGAYQVCTVQYAGAGTEKPGEDCCLLELELDAPCRSGLRSGEAEARENFDKHSAVSAVRLASISLGHCGNRASVMQQVECL